jgi:hypothetical protein
MTDNEQIKTELARLNDRMTSGVAHQFLEDLTSEEDLGVGQLVRDHLREKMKDVDRVIDCLKRLERPEEDGKSNWLKQTREELEEIKGDIERVADHAASAVSDDIGSAVRSAWDCFVEWLEQNEVEPVHLGPWPCKRKCFCKSRWA